MKFYLMFNIITGLGRGVKPVLAKSPEEAATYYVKLEKRFGRVLDPSFVRYLEAPEERYEEWLAIVKDHKDHRQHVHTQFPSVYMTESQWRKAQALVRGNEDCLPEHVLLTPRPHDRAKYATPKLNFYVVSGIGRWATKPILVWAVTLIEAKFLVSRAIRDTFKIRQCRVTGKKVPLEVSEEFTPLEGQYPLPNYGLVMGPLAWYSDYEFASTDALDHTEECT